MSKPKQMSLYDRITKTIHIAQHELPKYYQALGKFISTFSEVELCVQKALWSIARLDKKTAKAILSGNNVDASISGIRRIYIARGEPLEIILDRCLSQLAVINSARNDIVHYGADFYEEVPVVSNAPKALTEDKIRIFPISVEILENMIKDLRFIKSVLEVYSSLEFYSKDDFKSFCDEFEQHPFLYKSPQPVKNHRKSQNKHPKQKRPQKSSRE